MKNYSLKEILNMIELCKFAEIDGDCASIIVTPKNENERTISIGLKGEEDKFVFSFNDGKSFDEYVLPTLIEKFLEGDERLSWISTDSKELIITLSGNEFLIETNNTTLHETIGDLVENSNYKYKTELNRDDEAVDLILRYLKEKYKKRDFLDKLPVGLKNEMISIVSTIYKGNNYKNIKDNDLINVIKDNAKNMSKEAYGLFIRDYEENSFLITKDIKEYLQNEVKYNSYLDEEPYISIAKTGTKLINDGYFNIGRMPQKLTLEDLVDDNLKKIISERYKTKYRFLSEEIDKFKKANDEETVNTIHKYESYLIKTTRMRINKNKDNKDDCKEIVQNYPKNDITSLIKAITLYKSGKIDTEKLELVFEESETYKVKLTLTNGLAKDTNLFMFDKNDSYLNELVPKIINVFLSGDKISKVYKNGENSVITTDKGNEILGNNTLLQGLEKSNKIISEYEGLDIARNSRELTPYEETRLNELREKDNRIADLEKLKIKYEEKELTKEEYDAKREEIISDFSTVKYYKKQEIVLPKDNSHIKFDIPERKGLLPSNIDALASYFRKELLKERGYLTPAGLKEMKALRNISEEVNNIEIAKEKVLNHEMTEAKCQEIHDYYKKLLVSEIRKNYNKPNTDKEVKEPVPNTIVINSYVNKNNDRFDAMRELINNYKVLIDNTGTLNIYNRNNNEIYEPASEEERKIIELSTLWNTLTGIKSSKEDVTIGSNYAYSYNNEKLFNIIEKNILDHIDNKKVLEINRIKEEANNSGIQDCDKLIDRIFASENHMNYLIEAIGSSRNIDTSKYINKNAPLIGVPKRNKIQLESEIDNINDTYNKANDESSEYLKANIDVTVPKEDNNKCVVTIYVENEFDKQELYKKSFDKNVVMNELLEKVVDNFIETSGYNDIQNYEIPNTTNTGLTITGSNDNLLHITNISMEEAMLITKMANDKKNNDNTKVKMMKIGFYNESA